MCNKTSKFLILVIFLLSYNTTASENSTNVNTMFKKSNKIVGGQTTLITSVPYQVAVLASGSICGGSLIALNIVLTAAHCVVQRSASSILVRAGSNYYNRNGVTFNVLKVNSHQNFNFETMTHDIAVLRLGRSLTSNEMNSYGIKIIPLHTTSPSDNVWAIVSGYGKLSSEGFIAPILQSVSVNIINWNQCNQRYRWRLTETMLCAGSLSGGRDSCQGDSGGPLAYEGKLLGVVSWGYGCATAQYPGIYTSVPKMYSWIQSAVAGIV